MINTTLGQILLTMNTIMYENNSTEAKGNNYSELHLNQSSEGYICENKLSNQDFGVVSFW